MPRNSGLFGADSAVPTVGLVLCAHSYSGGKE